LKYISLFLLGMLILMLVVVKLSNYFV